MSDIQATTSANLTATLLASVKREKVPYAGKEKTVKKLPVPPPKQAQNGLTVHTFGQLQEPTSLPADLDDVPEFLKVENRKPLTPEQQATLDANMAKAKEAMTKSATAPLAEALKEVKTEKSRVRIEKLKASKSGEAAKMPLTGKAALKAIKTADKVLKAEEKKAVTFETLGQTAQGKANAKSWDAIPAVAKARKAAGKAKGARKPAKATSAPAAKNKATTKPRKAAGGESKAAIARRMLQRANGVTRADLIAATWPTIDIKAIAKRAGMKLTVKDGRYSIA